MNHYAVRRRLFGAVSLVLGVAAFLNASDARAAASPFDKLIVFGDSLSDTGASLFYTKALGLDRPIAPKYANGRWTNGTDVDYAALKLKASTSNSIWHWTLADKFGVDHAESFQAGTGNKLNFAAGGAVTGDGQQKQLGSPVSDNLGYQVKTEYLGNTPTFSDTTLYAIFGGGNDIRDAVRKNTTGDAVKAVGKAAADNIADLIGRIAVVAKAKDKKVSVVWPDVVPMQLIPDFADAYGGKASWRDAAKDASEAFKAEWATKITALRTDNTNLTLYDADLYQYFLALNNGGIPGLLGINTTDPILKFNGFGSLVFNPARNSTTVVPENADPDKFLFWDQVHPTQFGQALIGEFVAKSIPEPTVCAVLMVALVPLARTAARARR
jgi:outer membrane lipase/esterase